MAWFAARTLLAFDASSVAGAVVSRGVSGTTVRATARVALPEDTLGPSPFEPNVRRPDALAAALGELKHALEGPDHVTLVLPHGTARIALLDVPTGTEAADYARFRLASGLPFPVDEAIIDALPLRQGRALAGAVRRGVVAGYEQAAADAGLSPERVDLLALAAAAAGARERSDSRVEVTLGDVAFSLALFESGELVAFRTRWRDPGPGDARRIAREADRTARLGQGSSVSPRIRVSGPGTGEVVAALTAAGQVAEAGAEMAFLGAVAA